MKTSTHANHNSKKTATHVRQELDQKRLAELLERLKTGTINPADLEVVTNALTTLGVLTVEIQSRDATIARLRHLLFGPSTEKLADLLKTSGKKGADKPTESKSGTSRSPDPAVASEQGAGTPESVPNKPPQKRKGHGRNGAQSYTGAERTEVPHSTLHHGERCPGCLLGKVYHQAEPRTLVRVTGMAPLGAHCYELERLRCNGCGEVFTATEPDGVGPDKYDASAIVMIGMLKYATGMPFVRLEGLQKDLGIPLPASTQWDLVSSAQSILLPAHEELVRQAALGDVVYNDDTTMKLLSVAAANALKVDSDKERTGVFTSGIVSQKDNRTIALFYTGNQHAGENLARVLKERPSDLVAPIQMSDALSRNFKELGPDGTFKTVLASCLAHARREFVYIFDHFPDECAEVLQTFSTVYHFDDQARILKLDKHQRLHFHQDNSKPLMDKLEIWMKQQFDQRTVEPNSSLGKALRYLQNHWTKLTLFLRHPGAPLDNNICERALKKAILHRKNALFYKTMNGARVGDTWMSLLYSAELAHVNTFDYMVALLRHPHDVNTTPSAWMPWNFSDTLALLERTP